jgi:succinate dehydrogenase / fumarate reductase flavoprotein subunit
VESELEQALTELEKLRQRTAKVRVDGNRYFNPGWHMALDLQTMLTVAEAITRSALARKESRGGHTRSDYPGTDARFAALNLVTRRKDGEMTLTEQPLAPMPPDLKELVD